jgi:hypothetical protein
MASATYTIMRNALRAGPLPTSTLQTKEHLVKIF